MTSKQVAMIRYAGTNVAPNLASAAQDFCKDRLPAWHDPDPLETDLPQLQKLREHVSPFLQVKWSDEHAMRKVLELMDSIGTGKSPASAL